MEGGGGLKGVVMSYHIFFPWRHQCPSRSTNLNFQFQIPIYSSMTDFMTCIKIFKTRIANFKLELCPETEFSFLLDFFVSFHYFSSKIRMLVNKKIFLTFFFLVIIIIIFLSLSLESFPNASLLRDKGGKNNHFIFCSVIYCEKWFNIVNPNPQRDLKKRRVFSSRLLPLTGSLYLPICAMGTPRRA